MGDPGLSEEGKQEQFSLVAGAYDGFVGHFCWHTWICWLDISNDVGVEELSGHAVGGRTRVSDGLDARQ